MPTKVGKALLKAGKISVKQYQKLPDALLKAIGKSKSKGKKKKPKGKAKGKKKK